MGDEEKAVVDCIHACEQKFEFVGSQATTQAVGAVDGIFQIRYQHKVACDKPDCRLKKTFNTTQAAIAILDLACYACKDALTPKEKKIICETTKTSVPRVMKIRSIINELLRGPPYSCETGENREDQLQIQTTEDTAAAQSLCVRDGSYLLLVRSMMNEIKKQVPFDDAADESVVQQIEEWKRTGIPPFKPATLVAAAFQVRNVLPAETTAPLLDIQPATVKNAVERLSQM